MFVAPFEVRFSEHNFLTDEKIETVVQPDLVVVCDKLSLMSVDVTDRQNLL
jgi:hypothetical protein